MTTPSSFVSASRPGIFIEAVNLAAKADRHGQSDHGDWAPAGDRLRPGRATGRAATLGAVFAVFAVFVCVVLIAA